MQIDKLDRGGNNYVKRTNILYVNAYLLASMCQQFLNMYMYLSTVAFKFRAGVVSRNSLLSRKDRKPVNWIQVVLRLVVADHSCKWTWSAGIILFIVYPVSTCLSYVYACLPIPGEQVSRILVSLYSIKKDNTTLQKKIWGPVASGPSPSNTGLALTDSLCMYLFQTSSAVFLLNGGRELVSNI